MQNWNYETAYSRNLGLFSSAEQTLLRQSRVTVAGLGGVGGSNLMTLARLGIGRFTIADHDIFEVANINRQYGATISTLGKSKSDVMMGMIHDINPEADIRVFKEPLSINNIDTFLDGSDVVIDCIDIFNNDLRRLLFNKARERGIYVITGGPIGFSTAWMIFDPKGISFDEYFDISDKTSEHESFVAFVLGMAPPISQHHYMNLKSIPFNKTGAPSCGLACQLTSGVIAAETIKILLKRGKIFSAPYYSQFDPYLGLFIKKRLWLGNKNPLQKLKRKLMIEYLQDLTVPKAPKRSYSLIWDRIIGMPLIRFFYDFVLQRQTERLYLVFGGHIFFQTLRTAVQLDLFSLLDKEGPLTLQEMASRLSIANQPLRIVLLGLTSVKMIKKHGSKYSNTFISKMLFIKDSSRKITAYVELQHRAMYKSLQWMLDAVRENKNIGIKEFSGSEPTFYERLAHDPEVESIFQEAMHELSVQSNSLLTKYIDLSGVKHLVDVGGGDATNIITIAQQWPQLRATVFDSPTVCEIARKRIKEANMSDRLDATPGNCFNTPFPKDVDCLLFAHFFTIWGEQQNRELLKISFESLPVGGKVIIFNMMQNDNETGPLSAAIGSPYFLTLATGTGMLYTWHEYETWMKEAGFQSVRRQKLLHDHGFIIGTKR